MRRHRQHQQQTLTTKFFRTFFISIAVFLVLSVIVAFGYNFLSENDSIQQAIARAIGSNLKDSSSITDFFNEIPDKTNYLILGVDDDETRTDIIMVGTFDKNTEEFSIISIPRDTYVTMSKEHRKIIKDNGGLKTPSNGVMKINAVHHYAGSKYGVEFIVKQIEILLDIKIAYYVKLNLEGFRYIIDETGGIEFDVPQRMYYNDPTQNLHIDLQPGIQTLNGEQAEGLIRYRKADEKNPQSKGYAAGDIQRASVQQAFMKAFIQQVAKMKNLSTMLNTFINYVDTNVKLADISNYLPYATKISGEKITTYTLPGVDKTIKGVSYFIHNEKEAKELVDIIFKDKAVEVVASSIGKRILVLNGGTKTGLASQNKEFLEGKGFQVKKIGDYNGAKTNNTRIFVKNKGEGLDIAELYPDSEILVDKNYEKSYDIVVVVGIGE